jgi:hypothetical protein
MTPPAAVGTPVGVTEDGAVGVDVAVEVVVVLGVAVGVTVEVAGGVNRTSRAMRKPCSRIPATNTRSPRAMPSLLVNAGCFAVVIGPPAVVPDDAEVVDMPAVVAGVVMGVETVAEVLVMMIVTVALPLVTVTVVGDVAGAAIVLAAVVLPATVDAAGIMLPVVIACVAAGLLPVSAIMPVIELDALMVLVCASHHR